jgi:uncharacterized protein (UPF0303 family)
LTATRTLCYSLRVMSTADQQAVPKPKQRKPRKPPKRYELQKDYVQLSDQVVKKLCAYIRRGLDAKDAASIVGVSVNSFRVACTGSSPTHPDWANAVVRAMAECRLFWWSKLASSRRGAEIKACAHALTALDERFREAAMAGGGRILVYLDSRGPAGGALEAGAPPRVELQPAPKASEGTTDSGRA